MVGFSYANFRGKRVLKCSTKYCVPPGKSLYQSLGCDLGDLRIPHESIFSSVNVRRHRAERSQDLSRH